MRVLFLNHNIIGSGTFLRAWHLARELALRGHAVTLVTTSRSARLRARWSERGGVRVLESPDLLWGPGRTGWDPYNVARRIHALSGGPFELVHAFDCRPAAILPALAAARAGATLFIDWADWWGRGGTIVERSGWLVRTLFGPIETWFEESFRTRAAGATVISAALRERCMKLGVPADRILRLPNGCPPPAERPVPRMDARVRFGLEDAPLLVHLGTALPADAALMFEALRRARRQEPTLRLALVGGFRAAAPTDLVAEGAVRVTGPLRDDTVQQWLASADLCVASLTDTIASRGRWPSKVNDYLSAGRATVMTDVGDVAAIVRAARAGWVCAPDADAFASTIVQALRDDATRIKAERSALALAINDLAWSGIAAQLEAFYAHIAGRPGEPLRVSA